MANDRDDPPDRAALHGAALRHIARFAATEAGLVRVLDRLIARWLRQSGDQPDRVAGSRAAARAVARDLALTGLVDDAAFAGARVRRLVRAGRSRRAVASHLAAKGVAAEIADGTLPQDDFPAALAFVRRRRFGPFRAAPADPAERQRELGALARAGFSREIAERALRTELDDAERLLLPFKQG